MAQKCLACELTEEDKPLISIKYRGADRWICSKCLPQILHEKKDINDYI